MNNEQDNRNTNAHLSQSVSLDDEQRIKVLSPSALVTKRFIRNKLAVAGIIIISLMFLFSFVGGILSPYGESEVFKGYDYSLKEFAAVTENRDFRYINREGKDFPASARAKMVLATTTGATTFEFGGQSYNLIKEGEEFYRITSLEEVANILVVKGKGVLKASDGFDLPAGLQDAVLKAVDSGENSILLDGVSYALNTSGKKVLVMREDDLSLALKNVYEGASEEPLSYDFVLNAERARLAGESAFTLDGVSYALETNDGLTNYSLADDGTPVASASTFVIKSIEVGQEIPPTMRAAVQAAIAEGPDTVFTAMDEDGTEQEYTLRRKDLQFTVMRMTETYLIRIHEAPSAEHWLGLDGNGMDVLTRLMYGGRISLIIGFVVIIIETIIGVILGGFAGYFGGWVDNLIMRIVDIFNCIPSYPLYIIAGSLMETYKVESQYRIYFLMLIISILGWPSIARIVRGQILTLREQEFMTATESLGLSVHRRVFRHLIPNVIPQLIVIDTMTLGGVILTEATLSFLGLGVKFPLASWGSIISAVSNVFVMTNYWFVWIPAGILILLTVLGFNFVGDGLRDAFDPKMKR